MTQICRTLVAHPAFDGVVAFLIVCSLALLLPEIFLGFQDDIRLEIGIIQEYITGIFAIELVIRFGAMQRRERYLREYWLDLLGVVPVLRPIRQHFRSFKLLRVLRLFRLARILTSRQSPLGRKLASRSPELTLVSFFVAFSLWFGALGLAWFEQAHTGFQHLADSFWSALFSLITIEYVDTFPQTLGGKLMVLVMEFAGLTLLALFTGSTSAFLVEKIRDGGWMGSIPLDELEGHVIVCGWNSGTVATLSRLQKHPQFKDQYFVVIVDRDDLPGLHDLPVPTNIRRIRDDFTRAEVLSRANVRHAAVALLFSDVHRGRSRQDADARTVLAALTIEKLNPSVHTCAELSNRANEHHLRMGRVHEVVVTQDLAGHLLAQAALDSAGARLFRQLVLSEAVVNVPVEEAWVGLPFTLAVAQLIQTQGVIPVAVLESDGQITVNPGERLLRSDEALLCLQSRS